MSSLFGDDDDTPAVSPGYTPPPGSVPDQAAQRNLGLADSVQEYSNANGAYTRPLMDNANAQASRVGSVQGDIMDLNRGVAQENLDFQNEVYRPLQRDIVSDAQGYDTAERRESAAGLAMANTGSAIDRQQQAQQRSLASRGVDPSSGNAMALGRSAAVTAGAAQAAAGNQARMDIEKTGFERKLQANQTGNALAGNAATASQISSNAGTSAVNTAAVPLQLQSQQVGNFTNLTNTGVNANNSAGNLMRAQGAGATTGNSNDGINQGLGQVAGAAAGYYFGGKAAGGKVGLADMHGKRGDVNLDVGEYKFPAPVAAMIGTAKLKALNEGRATIQMKKGAR